MSGSNISQEYFYALADFATGHLQGTEIFTAYLIAENSDFIRFNHGKIRQPGSIVQANLQLRLMQDVEQHPKQSSITIGLVGDVAYDQQLVAQSLKSLRSTFAYISVDPHLLINTTVQNSEHIEENQLGSVEDMVDDIIRHSDGLDCVGILANGGIFHGFANSLGQRNWFASYSFNWDWSLVHSVDKAVKTSYAGKQWHTSQYIEKMNLAKQQLQMLSRPSKTLDTGEYRAYLSPVALWEILELISWGGFGLASHKNKTTPLLHLLEGNHTLSPKFSLLEDVGGGCSPNFQADGFLRPHTVSLIEQGRLTGALVSPRSAKEFSTQTTGASSAETPDSLLVSAGTLAKSDIISTLDTGVYIGNLWYLNYSDRAAGRMTGMTRFATFWVENGEIVAPINVMRFDDTISRMLGTSLEAVTAETEFLLSSSTYFHRSTGSARLPGVLLNSFRFTL